MFIHSVRLHLRIKHINFITLFFIIISFPNIYCFKKVPNSAPEVKTDKILTLESLQKIDDYPLYTMIYKGGYGFGDYLLTGRRSNKTKRSAYNVLESSNWACTCFAAMGGENNLLFGRNFDFYHKPSLLLFTDPPDGYASVSMVDIFYLGYQDNTPLTSITDRLDLLDAPYHPFDGMNEHGVTIGLMAVPEALPPINPGKVRISDLAVIRLVLDYAQNTEEAISLFKNYNIRFYETPLHYLIADPSGNSAVVEFVDGKLIVIRNNEPFQVSTNFVICNSGAPEIRPCWRYDRVYITLKENNGNITEEDAMNILELVSGEITRWSVIYNMSSCDLQIAVGRQFNSVKKFNLFQEQ